MPVITRENAPKQISTEEVMEKLAPTENDFRQDLRPPQVVFGRCGLTGEWGKVITLDLGDMIIQAPGYVQRNQATGEDVEIPSRDIVYQNQFTASRRGLQMLVDYMDNQSNPIPAVTPNLVYMWQVQFIDGSATSQFYMDESTGAEGENVFPFDKQSEISSITLIDRSGTPVLPMYTFAAQTGKFYKNGSEIDTEYEDFDLPVPNHQPTNYRKNTITFSSIVGADGLSRTINGILVGTIYCIGWKAGHIIDENVPANIIAIDSQGNWRVWEQKTRLDVMPFHTPESELGQERERITAELVEYFGVEEDAD